MTKAKKIINKVKTILDGKTIFITTNGDLQTILTLQKASTYSFNKGNEYFVGVKDIELENIDLFTNIKNIENIKVDNLDESINIQLSKDKYINITYM